MAEARLLIIDDEPNSRETLSDIFHEKGYRVSTACTGREGIAEVEQGVFDVALIDIKLPDMDGTALLREFKKVHPEMVCIMVTGHASVQNAVKALKDGADGYFTKPLVMEDMLLRVEGALEKRRLERELRESEDKYRGLVETSTDAIVSVNGEGEIIQWNRAATQMFGYAMNEVIGRPVDMLVPDNNQGEDFKRWKKFRATGECKFTGKMTELTAQRKDGTTIPVELSLSALNTGDCHIFTGIFRDISERKKAEEQINASLEEKEVLLREIHHRVKNNLQVIISLLKLQSVNIEDKKALELFKESQRRVQSMAFIHEKLYQSKDLGRIDFAGYIRDLTTYLFHSYGVSNSAIKLKVNVDHISLGIDTAIPCSLVINELICNSLKHAFPDGKEGEIHIDFHSDNGGEFTLIVSDNGVGLPKDLDFRNTHSLGLQLVANLAETQLQGKIELNRAEGTGFIIKFKEMKYKGGR